MTETLGQKIKKLRKELKLTQSQLAGSEMTKSMLSHIENNQASPSMKSLQHLSKRLGKPVSYFLDEDSHSEEEKITKIPIEELNSEMENVNKLMENSEFDKAKENINNILKKFSFNKTTIIYAEVISKLSICLMELEQYKEGEKLIESAVKVYMDNHLFIKAAKIYDKLQIKYFKNFNYDKCLKIIEKTWNIYNNSIDKDNFFEIELLCFQQNVYTSLSNFEEALSTLEKAMNISNKKNSYYLSGEIYRRAAASYLVLKSYDKFKFYITKAKQYAEFTEDKLSIASIQYTLAVYENIQGSPHKALEHIKLFIEYNGEEAFISYLEKAKAYYKLNKYDLALENILNIEYLDYSYNKFDYLFKWEGKVYEGLIRHALGNSTEAAACINLAISKMTKFSNSDSLVFAYKSLSSIYSDMKDFEKAFYSLKKVEDMQAALNK